MKNKKKRSASIGTSRRTGQTWLVLGCAHVPAHNVPLFNRFLAMAKQVKPYGLVIAGDFIDLYSLGSYNADSVGLLRDITLDDEYKAGNKALNNIDIAFKGAKKHYIYGNHEDRYHRERMRGDRAKYGSKLVSPTEAMTLHERKFRVHEKWTEDIVRLGSHLDVTHGVFCNLHTAKKHVDEFQGSVMFAHTHRVQTHVAGKMAGFSIGTMCDICSPSFHYMSLAQRKRWSNGFGHVVIDDSGDYYASVIQVHKDRFVLNGKLW